MLRAWKNRKRLKQQESGKSWLLRIAANLCRDRIRRKSHPASQTQPIDLDQPKQAQSPPGDAITNEQIGQIHEAMTTLPLNYRTVMHLHSIEQLSLAEIANITGDQVGTVKVRLSRARKKMREALTKIGVLE